MPRKRAAHKAGGPSQVIKFTDERSLLERRKEDLLDLLLHGRSVPWVRSKMRTRLITKQTGNFKNGPPSPLMQFMPVRRTYKIDVYVGRKLKQVSSVDGTSHPRIACAITHIKEKPALAGNYGVRPNAGLLVQLPEPGCKIVLVKGLDASLHKSPVV